MKVLPLLKFKFIVLLILESALPSLGQRVEWGLSFGFYQTSRHSGVAVCDSITVNVGPSGSTDLILGVTLSTKLTDHLSFQSGLNYFKDGLTTEVFNNTVRDPLRYKLASRVYRNIELPLLAKYRSKKLGIEWSAGLSINVPITASGNDYLQCINCAGTQEVVANLRSTIRPVVITPTVGAEIVSNRFSVGLRFQSDGIHSRTRPIEFFGTFYDFDTSTSYWFLTAGYRFRSKKKNPTGRDE
jgi:hypothetical protein